MNAVIYARYSSAGQTEQSIEGQLQAAYSYAAKNGYVVTGEYIDRAVTGTTTDKRDEFQRMIADSARGEFEIILVYQLDRFARNRYDSAINKAKLKKNGVRVVSVRENIADDASGVLMEAVLEGMAEYYSAELSQKVRRGVEISASKHRFTGGTPPLGFQISNDKRYEINSTTAPIVEKIFDLYASGSTVKEITDYMNGLGIKTSQGSAFNKNSLRGMLRNKRYIGTYIFHDTETPNAIPRIVSDELFYTVQDRLDKNKKAPARARAKEEYLLTTKLFCGYDKEMMVGVSGTSKTGKKHSYYACKNMWNKKGCQKKNIKKDWIEALVLEKARSQLTDDNIAMIAAEFDKLYRQMEESADVKRLNSLLAENATVTENLLRALEHGQEVEIITERISQRKKERQQYEAELDKVKRSCAPLKKSDIELYLTYLQNGSIEDIRYQRLLITVFIDSIYLKDDQITIAFRAGGQPLTLNLELIDDISNDISSNMEGSAPPRYRRSGAEN